MPQRRRIAPPVQPGSDLARLASPQAIQQINYMRAHGGAPPPGAPAAGKGPGQVPPPSMGIPGGAPSGGLPVIGDGSPDTMWASMRANPGISPQLYRSLRNLHRRTERERAREERDRTRLQKAMMRERMHGQDR